MNSTEPNTAAETTSLKPPHPSPLRFSQLSIPRQALVRLCQTTNYGCIRNLEIRDSDPVFSPPPVVLMQVKLDTDEEALHEGDLPDFLLRDEVCRLMDWLDQLKNGGD
jgi:hypothetical protein